MSQESRPSAFPDAQDNYDPNYYTYVAFQGEYTGTNLIYRGYAKPGTSTASATWQICKMTYDGSNNLTAIQWPLNANGAPSADYEFIWTSRASYTYQ